MLLNQDIPEPDTTARLLNEAIKDAIKWRAPMCAACEVADSGVCEACRPDIRQAGLYEGLWLQLGIIYPVPRQANLTAVDR
jgi:hypothetical protein